MLKKGVLVVIMLVLCSFLVSALSFNAKVTKIQDRIDIEGIAEFNLTIYNNLEYKQKFSIRTLDYPQWDVSTRPVVNPITLEVPGNGSNSIKLYADPLNIISKGAGAIDVNVQIKNSLGEKKVVPLRVSLVSTESLLSGYVPTVIASVKMFQDGEDTKELDPRKTVTFSISLNNQNPLDYEKLVIKLNSNTINKEVIDKLGPRESKKLEVEVALDPKLDPQDDKLTVTVYSDEDIIVDPMVSKFEIKPYSLISKNIVETRGFLKVIKDITFTNVGNSRYEGKVSVETTSFSNMFTITRPKGQVIGDDKDKKIEWDISLEPGEETKFILSENYSVILVLILLIIIGIIAYKISKSPLVLVKEASNVKKKEGGLSEFKIVITVRNRGAKKLNHIHVSDKVPKIADVEKELSIGTLQPAKIMKHEHKGSMIKWVIDELAPGEERIINYRIKSSLSILGDFSLPVAKAHFWENKKEKSTKSNSLSISS